VVHHDQGFIGECLIIHRDFPQKVCPALGTGFLANTI
jgi:hypothetical protein